MLAWQEKKEKNKRESNPKGWLGKGCQGFFKKYYLMEGARNKRLTEGGDFLKNPKGLTLTARVRRPCASQPIFAASFVL
jgi:hypothetical protein